MIGNIGQMMKQAQQMQEKLQSMQQRMAEEEVTGQSGGGMVTVTVTGNSEVKSVKLDESIVDKDEIEVLEDLIVAAVNDARTRAETMMREESEKMMKDMGLPPGMQLPF